MSFTWCGPTPRAFYARNGRDLWAECIDQWGVFNQATYIAIINAMTPVAIERQAIYGNLIEQTARWCDCAYAEGGFNSRVHGTLQPWLLPTGELAGAISTDPFVKACQFDGHSLASKDWWKHRVTNTDIIYNAAVDGFSQNQPVTPGGLVEGRWGSSANYFKNFGNAYWTFGASFLFPFSPASQALGSRTTAGIGHSNAIGETFSDPQEISDAAWADLADRGWGVPAIGGTDGPQTKLTTVDVMGSIQGTFIAKWDIFYGTWSRTNPLFQNPTTIQNSTGFGPGTYLEIVGFSGDGTYEVLGGWMGSRTDFGGAPLGPASFDYFAFSHIADVPSGGGKIPLDDWITLQSPQSGTTFDIFAIAIGPKSGTTGNTTLDIINDVTAVGEDGYTKYQMGGTFPRKGVRLCVKYPLWGNSLLL